jgi:hypothetical protein
MNTRASRLVPTATVVVLAALAGVTAAGQAFRAPAAAFQGSKASRTTIAMPPIPARGYAPARPVDVARAAYRFAGEHPEILKFVPCYCGCEAEGHAGNEACFVRRRDAAGNVVEWDMHGYGCAVCIDVAREAMQQYNSGADVASIRAAIERKWTPNYPSKTPTPLPPKKTAR